MKERALREIPENREQTLAALILQERKPSAYWRIPTPPPGCKNPSIITSYVKSLLNDPRVVTPFSFLC